MCLWAARLASFRHAKSGTCGGDASRVFWASCEGPAVPSPYASSRVHPRCRLEQPCAPRVAILGGIHDYARWVGFSLLVRLYQGVPGLCVRAACCSAAAARMAARRTHGCGAGRHAAAGGDGQAQGRSSA